MNPQVEQLLANQLSTVVKNVEDQLDEQIERLHSLGSDDLEKLRQERLVKLKKESQEKIRWRELGHGEYSEIAEEKEFFDVARKSKNVICHFFRTETFRCRIVDKHLTILAPAHLETKFCKINAEKCPFLTTRLGIRVLPAILILVDGIVVDRIIGFTDLGGQDDFSTVILEWRLAQKDVISYTGDKLNPPETCSLTWNGGGGYQKSRKHVGGGHFFSKTIRQGLQNDESDSGEEEGPEDKSVDLGKTGSGTGSFELTPEELALLEELNLE